MRRYGGLVKATITVRDDGLLDVVRERDTGNGESFRGCATLDEAFAVIRAHDTTDTSRDTKGLGK